MRLGHAMTLAYGTFGRFERLIKVGLVGFAQGDVAQQLGVLGSEVRKIKLRGGRAVRSGGGAMRTLLESLRACFLGLFPAMVRQISSEHPRFDPTLVQVAQM